MRIHLLRHGKTASIEGTLNGRTDVALMAEGRRQMEEALSTRSGWTRWVTSPKQRCLNFTEQQATKSQQPFYVEMGLRELDFGEWDGQTVTHLNETCPELLALFWEDPYAFTPPGAEPMEQFAQRIKRSVQYWQQSCPEEEVLWVTHGGVIRYLLAEARGLPREQLLSIDVPYAHYCVIEANDEGQWREVV